MSDRAGTEKNFNRLLEEFRKEVLPQVVDNWGALTENQQKPISAMNNLFCGLHLLVGMADVAEESLKKFSGWKINWICCSSRAQNVPQTREWYIAVVADLLQSFCCWRR